MKIKRFFLCLVIFLLAPCFAIDQLKDTFPLSHFDVKNLLSTLRPHALSVEKLGEILNTVYFVSSPAEKFQGFDYDKEHELAFLRVTHWDLENLDRDKLETIFDGESSSNMDLLKTSEILTLNDVDFYNENSDYKNAVELIAQKLNANYAFAAEFLEASPEFLKKPTLPEGFRGLRGNAIVSKYPIKSAHILRLPSCYDWFVEEAKYIQDDPDDRERIKVKNRKGEGEVPYIRRGGRNALIADLVLPNRNIVTVVSSQLENRAESKCRQNQLYSILYHLRDSYNPIVFGVALNNFGKNTGPQSISHRVKKTVSDKEFLAKQVLKYINPLNFITSLTSLTYGNYRKVGNPTVKHVPILFPNKAYGLFKTVAEFKFLDGTSFDLSGEKDFSNSNQRKNRTFSRTYEYKGWLGTGRKKVDWIFVKPVYDINKRKYYYPLEAKTLGLDFVLDDENRSVHHPISLELAI